MDIIKCNNCKDVKLIIMDLGFTLKEYNFKWKYFSECIMIILNSIISINRNKK